MRCFSILLLISCGMREGRNALITAGTGIVLFHNIKNIFLNLEGLVNSITCNLEAKRLSINVAPLDYYVKVIRWIYNEGKQFNNPFSDVVRVKDSFHVQSHVLDERLKMKLMETRQQVQSVAENIFTVLDSVASVGQNVLFAIGIAMVLAGTAVFFRRYLTAGNRTFQKSYITQGFTKLDDSNREQGKPCVLPLSKSERKRYVTIPPLRLTGKEWKRVGLFLLPVFTNVCIWTFIAASDALLYWLILSVTARLQELPVLKVPISLSNIVSISLFLVMKVAVEVGLLRADHQKLTDRVSETENKLLEIAPKQETLEATITDLTDRVLRLEKWVEDADGRNRRDKVWVVGLLEGTEGKDMVGFLEEWMRTVVTPGGLTPFFTLERAHRVPSRPLEPGRPPRVVVAKLLHYRDRDTLLQRAREAVPFNVANGEVTLFPDFTLDVQTKRASFLAVKRVLREEGIQYSLLFQAKLRKGILVDPNVKHYNTYESSFEIHLLEHTCIPKPELSFSKTWVPLSIIIIVLIILGLLSATLTQMKLLVLASFYPSKEKERLIYLHTKLLKKRRKPRSQNENQDISKLVKTVHFWFPVLKTKELTDSKKEAIPGSDAV
ncbi:dendritic cell-specific transmembrane protein [Pleurodeles waltl]